MVKEIAASNGLAPVWTNPLYKGSFMQSRSTTMRRVNFLVAFSIALLAAATVCAPAQTAAPAVAPSSQAAEIPSPNSNRISIDVGVNDKLGHHVGGLKQEDFTLLDNNQRRNIIDFREIDPRSSTADPVHIVIVVDMINTGFEVVAREREQLGEFLPQDGGRLAHPTSIAIFTEKGIQIEKGSTTDGNALLGVLNKASTDLRAIGRSAGFYGAAERLEWSLNQLGQLTAFEATQPGRKLAFFISPGWALFPRAGIEATDKQRKTTFSSIVEFTNGLRAAHLVLYTLDPFSLGRSNPFFYQTYLKGIPNANKAEYGDLALQVLAVHSGGTVQTTGMDIKGEINNAVRDANAYYTLTFDAPPADHTDEYHDLHVQVNKPDTTVRSTSGYYSNVQH
jgi:VWFA-related protein